MKTSAVHPFIVGLKKALPETSWPWVIAALRQDPLIWESLQNEALIQSALAQFGEQGEEWHPGSLALLALNAQTVQMESRQKNQHTEQPYLFPSSAELRENPQVEFDASIQKKIVQVLEMLTSLCDIHTPKTSATAVLAQVGWIALAFREQWLRSGTWEEALKELSPAMAKLSATPAHHRLLRCALACLPGLIPDVAELLHALLPPGAPATQSFLALHVLLSNPVPPIKQLKTIVMLLTSLPDAGQVHLLQALEQERPELAAQTAQLVLDGAISGEESPVQGCSPLKDPLAQLSSITALTYQANLRQLSGDAAAALPFLAAAQQSTAALLAALVAKQARAAAAAGQLEEAVQFWRQAVDLSRTPQAALVFNASLASMLLSVNQPEAAQACLEGTDNEDTTADEPLQSEPVEAVLAAAELAVLHGNIDQARQLALRALKTLSATGQNDGPAVQSSSARLAGLHLKLRQYGEACQAVQWGLEGRPNDLNLLALLCQAQRGCQDDEAAVETAQIATALAPQRADLHRQLAGALEAVGDWDSAYEEHRALIEGKFIEPDTGAPAKANSAAWQAVGRCALSSARYEEAIDASEQALQTAGDDLETAKAYTLHGKVLAAIGDPHGALAKFSQATLLTPNLPDPWLATANVQKEMGQASKAVETLRSASLVSPNSAELYLALGEAYLEDWEGRGHASPTQALATFQHAASLSPDHPQIALRLGQTLQQLGHMAEARLVLEQAYVLKPKHPNLAFTYAQTLLALEDVPSALPVLRQVVVTKPQEAQPYLELARAILMTEDPVHEALAALKVVLDMEPDHAEANALLAEALMAAGELDAALNAYQAALETNLIEDNEWFARLSLGMGSVALALNQPEVAIASLQEAAAAAPRDGRIQKSLAEAYQKADLVEEALTAGRAALQLCLDDLDVLAWFSQTALGWFEDLPSDHPAKETLEQVQAEAINALTRAVSLAPFRVDLVVQLGRIQLQSGNRTAALATFHQVIASENATGEDLFQAAQHLLELKDPASAVTSLERGLHLVDPDESTAPFAEKMHLALIEAYQQSGNLQAALAAIDQAIYRNPKELGLYRTKADLFHRLGRVQEAQNTLEQALKLEIDQNQAADLRYRTAVLLYAAGDLPGALSHAAALMPAATGHPGHPYQLAARVLAADIARTMLKPDRARGYLGAPPSTVETAALAGRSLPGDIDLVVPYTFILYQCLRAELALHFGEEIEAAQATIAAAKAFEETQNKPDMPLVHARLLALQARLFVRQGDEDRSLETLREALSSAEAGLNAEPAQPSILCRPGVCAHILAEAALELGQWETALYLARKAVELSPAEPLFHLGLARAVTLRAETQQLCQELDVVEHAPGAAALAPHARETFRKAIEETARLAIKSHSEAEPTHPGELLRWQARGLAVFFPSSENAQALATLPVFPHSVEDVAAQMAAFRMAQNQEVDSGSPVQVNIAVAIQAARSYPNNPLVLAQLALTLAQRDYQLKDALNTARLAVRQTKPSNGQSSLGVNILQGLTPNLGKILLAKLAYRSDEIETAGEAVQEALACWPSEPRWRALAAGVCAAEGDHLAAIAHLEQAVAHETKHIPHFLALGKAYLKRGQDEQVYIERAVEILEKACTLAPSQAEPWLAAAEAWMRAEREDAFEKAAACVDKAIAIDGRKPEPLLIRAEIALQAGQFQEAHDQVIAAMQLNNSKAAGGTSASHQPTRESSAVMLLARALDGLGKSAEALSTIESALPQASQPLPLLLERIRLLRRTQGSSQALLALNQLATEYPDEPLVSTELAYSQTETGDDEAAIRSAQRALQLISLSNENASGLQVSILQQAELHLLLGRLLRKFGHLDQALYHLNEALQLQPHLVEPYLELGRTHQDRRQNLQALQIYQQATSVAPDDPRPYYQSALAMKESKDYLGAETMLRKAAQLAPSDVSIHKQLSAVVALNLVHNRRRKTVEA